MDQVLTSVQHVPRCVRVFPVSHPPLPPPSLSSSGFVTVSPTFSPIKEIRDYNLHLKPQTVLDSHPFDWWSFLLSSSSKRPLSCEILFFISFHSPLSLSALSLSWPRTRTASLSSRGGACPIQARGTSLPITLLSSAVPSMVSIDLNNNRFPSRSVWNGSRASPTFSPAMNSGRLPNGPPPSQQQPKDPGSFPPLNQQNGPRPQESDRIIQPLTGLIVRACMFLP